MPDFSHKRVPMPQQEPEERCRNFREVALGYTAEMAREEAARCLNCKNHPCTEGCPVGVRIPDFIARLARGEAAEAYRAIRATNALPAICGRVCPQESQCEARCVRGLKGEPVAIGRLERFAADYAMAHPEAIPPETPPVPTGKRVAVVGSGPAGLTCAGELARRGHGVTVFEALHTPGGVLMYGIPEFRLPKALVAREIDALRAAGVRIETDMVMGKVLSLDDLLENGGYDAVFLGTGAGLPNFLHIPGKNLNGVLSANEFLARVNLMRAYAFPAVDTPVRIGKRVAVIGGGNVAMDAARCALRLGAEEVSIIYRRSEAEMPARREEIEHAKEEGVRFQLLKDPTSVEGNEAGWVTGLCCVDMALGAPDASGRRRPEPVPGSEKTLPMDTVILAIGNSPNPLLKNATPDLPADRRGCFLVEEETGLTGKSRVYAGGDAVTGAATVILAMGAGKRAAQAIDRALTRE